MLAKMPAAYALSRADQNTLWASNDTGGSQRIWLVGAVETQ